MGPGGTRAGAAVVAIGVGSPVARLDAHGRRRQVKADFAVNFCEWLNQRRDGFIAIVVDGPQAFTYTHAVAVEKTIRGQVVHQGEVQETLFHQLGVPSAVLFNQQGQEQVALRYELATSWPCSVYATTGQREPLGIRQCFSICAIRDRIVDDGSVYAPGFYDYEGGEMCFFNGMYADDYGLEGCLLLSGHRAVHAPLPLRPPGHGHL